MTQTSSTRPGRSGPAAEWFDGQPGEHSTIRVPSRATGDGFAVMESVLEPGTHVPEHTHRETETFVVIEGEMTYSVAGRAFTRRAGTSLTVSGGVPHAWRNAGERPARVLAIFAPGHVEPLFAEAAGKGPEELALLAAGYGTFVTGPPIPDHGVDTVAGGADVPH